MLLSTSRQLEDTLHHRYFCSSSVESTKGNPIICHHPSTQHIGTAVDGSSDERHLQQTGKFLNILNGGTRVHHASLIGKLAVRAHQRLPSDSLSKDFHSQNIRNHVFRLSINIRMHQRHVIVGGYDIPERRQALFNALHDDAVGKRIAQVLEFQVRRGVGNEQSPTIPDRRASDEATAGNRGVNDGNVIAQFGFKDGKEVFGTSNACVYMC